MSSYYHGSIHGLLENEVLYRKFIKSLINRGWERFWEDNLIDDDEEIVFLLLSVYKHKSNARKKINTTRNLLQNHQEKIKNDIDNYLVNGEDNIYPPNHEIYTLKKLYPFLDSKMFEIFTPLNVPYIVPRTILKAAAQYMDNDDQDYKKVSLSYICYLGRKSVKWLAMKLFPEKWQQYIICVNSINTILEKISRRENIPMEELNTELNIKYKNLRCEIRNKQKEKSTDEYKLSEGDYEEIKYSRILMANDKHLKINVASDAPMKEANYPMLESNDHQMTMGKIKIEPGFYYEMENDDKENNVDNFSDNIYLNNGIKSEENSSQVYQSSPINRDLMLNKLGMIERRLNYSAMKQKRLNKLMMTKSQMVEMKMKRLMLKHARLREVMSKKIEIIETAAMMEKKEMFKLMIKMLKNENSAFN